MPVAAESTAQTIAAEPPPPEPIEPPPLPPEPKVFVAVLPELRGLIDQIWPWYPTDTIEGLLAIVAAAETRLVERAAA